MSTSFCLLCSQKHQSLSPSGNVYAGVGGDDEGENVTWVPRGC